jgi:hypothetical protein
MIRRSLSTAQKERLERLRRTGFELYSLVPPESLKANAEDMVCYQEYKYFSQFVLISRNGYQLRRLTIWYAKSLR